MLSYKEGDIWTTDKVQFIGNIVRPRSIHPLLKKEEMNCESRIDEVFIKIFQESNKDDDTENPMWNEKNINSITKQLEILYTIITISTVDELPIEMIRGQNILEFLYDFLFFVICSHSRDSRYVSEISIGCSLLAILLDKHIYAPVEVVDTPLFKTLKQLAVSTNEADQASSVDVFASLIQPKEEFPQIIIDKFLPLAVTLRTTFPSLIAKEECLYFLHEFIKNVRDIPIEVIEAINEGLSDVLLDKKLIKLHSRAVECLQMELLYYPASYEMLIDNGLIPLVNTLLQSNYDNCLHAANRLFSIIFTDHDLNLDLLLPHLKYESIVDNVGYEVNQNVQISSIYLVMDMVSNGSQFIEPLFHFHLVNLISDIFDDSELSIKKLFIKLITNLLFCCSAEQLMELITSRYFELSITGIRIFTEPKPILMFLNSVYSAIQKFETTESYEKVRQLFLSENIAESLTELLDSSDKYVFDATQIITNKIMPQSE